MARRTAAEETEQQMTLFFQEAEDFYMGQIKITRQKSRRSKLLNEMDSLDSVKARFYHWLNGDIDNAK